MCNCGLRNNSPRHSVSCYQQLSRRTDYCISLNSIGPTPIPTCPLGMCLSCNFVNVYTIVDHEQYTYMCTRAHPQWTSSRGKARVGQVGLTSRRAERAASAAAVGSPRAAPGRWRPHMQQRADCRTRRLPCKYRGAEFSVEVRVGVGVLVGPLEFSYYCTYGA